MEYGNDAFECLQLTAPANLILPPYISSGALHGII